MDCSGRSGYSYCGTRPPAEINPGSVIWQKDRSVANVPPADPCLLLPIPFPSHQQLPSEPFRVVDTLRRRQLILAVDYSQDTSWDSCFILLCPYLYSFPTAQRSSTLSASLPICFPITTLTRAHFPISWNFLQRFATLRTSPTLFSTGRHTL